MQVIEQNITPNTTYSDRVYRNNRQQAKISWKRKQSLEMAEAIRQFLDDNNIPLMKICSDEYMEFQELLTFYWKLLKSNKSIYGVFTNPEGGEKKIQQIAMMYSMHRLDPVWNFRKAQLIGGIYRNFISTKTLGVGPDGELKYLIKEKTGVHIVLTMPHKGGMYRGKKFYARDLLKAFHELRRLSFFKEATYGGEYGLEIKKSKSANGLHIHLHSLCFLNEGYSVLEFREWIRERWNALTGATNVHCGKLYYHKRDEKGQWIMKVKSKFAGVTENEDGTYTCLSEEALERKKFYCDKNTPVEMYTAAILESIKYHFKGDEMVQENGEYDVPLMHEILSNSRGLRFYSRYGAFYKEKELNFDALKSKPGIVSVEDVDGDNIEEMLSGSSERGKSNLVNPFTKELAIEGEYKVALCNPERLRYSGRSTISPYTLRNYSDEYFLEIQDGIPISDIVKAICNHNLTSIIQWGSKKQFN